MAESTHVFTYHTPDRVFKGDPYEAAGQTVEQTERIFNFLRVALADTEVQVRNAWMQRNLDNGGAPRAEEWPEAPEAKRLQAIIDSLTEDLKILRGVKAAASYNPKAPIPKE